MYQQDHNLLKNRWLSFWNRENHDRPLISVTAPRDGAVYDKDPFPGTRERWFNTELVVERTRRGIENTFYGGEAIPYTYPNLGPDVLGAICGCDLEFGEHTSWAIHNVTDWESLPPIVFDSDNKWFVKIQELTRALLEDSGGDYLIGVADYHPGIDTLVSLRGPETLCMDLYDAPEQINPRVKQVFEVFKSVFEAQSDMIATKQEGATSWMAVWHPEANWYVTSSDFSALVSEDHFEEFVLPGLNYELDYLPASIYHLDGPGSLKHLDRLLQLPKLNGIQWVQGAGSAPSRDWIPVYKKIQAAGKLIEVNCEPDDIAPLCEALDPEGVHLNTYASSESEARDLIKLAESIYKDKRRM